MCIRELSGKKIEKLLVFSYGLYNTYISAIKTHVIVRQKLMNKNEFIVWHALLDHLDLL